MMTTGATLLVIMDLALLLWILTVWKGLMLSDCLLSAIPFTWRLSSGEEAETGCGAALAVVPMLHKQLPREGMLARKLGDERKSREDQTEGRFPDFTEGFRI